MLDLFNSDPKQLNLPNGNIAYYPNFMDSVTRTLIFICLEKIVSGNKMILKSLERCMHNQG